MVVDPTPRSRRALLVGAIGGVAAFVATAVQRPAAVYAGVDGDVVLGDNNTSAVTTRIENSTNSNDVLQVVSGPGAALYAGATSGYAVLANATTGRAVYGNAQGPQTAEFVNTTGSGVYAHAPDGIAIRAESTTSIGVQGQSSSSAGVLGSTGSGWGVFGSGTTGIGVAGETNATNKPASIGVGKGNSTGVQGYSGVDVPAPKAKTGVFGQADQDSDSRGVWGYAPAGQGVRGQATSGIGVRGLVTSGVGLSGEATTGYALRTKGRVRLDQSAGQATIASGTSSIVVTPGVDLTTTSAVVATLNGDAGGSTAVKRVAVNATANTFTVYLTGNATASVKLAWIVLG